MGRRTASASKQLILDAAEEIFYEKGYADATMRAVAVRAGISIGGIYIYYQSKEQLYEDVLRRQLDNLRQKISEFDGKEPLAALELFFNIHVDLVLKEAKLISMMIKEYDLPVQRATIREFRKLQRHLLVQILREGVATGIFRELNYEKTVDVITYCLKGLILSYISGEVKDVKSQGRHILEFVMDAIMTSRTVAL